MAARAGQLLAGEAAGVQGVAVEVEAGGQETLRLLGAEPRVADEVGVGRHPEDVLGREGVPAVRAGGAPQEG